MKPKEQGTITYLSNLIQHYEGLGVLHLGSFTAKISALQIG